MSLQIFKSYYDRCENCILKQAPKHKARRGGGAPRYDVSKDTLQFMIFEMNFKQTETAKLLGVSAKTIRRRMRHVLFTYYLRALKSFRK